MEEPGSKIGLKDAASGLRAGGIVGLLGAALEEVGMPPGDGVTTTGATVIGALVTVPGSGTVVGANTGLPVGTSEGVLSGAAGTGVGNSGLATGWSGVSGLNLNTGGPTGPATGAAGAEGAAGEFMVVDVRCVDQIQIREFVVVAL
jgi:hypothetical protein